MGRGNACIHGEFEGLFYIDYDNFTCYTVDEDGNETEERDYDLEQELVEDSIINFKYSFRKKYPVFDFYGEKRNGYGIILESGLFEIAIEDNEWSYAVKLLQREDLEFSAEGLQGKFYETYLKGIKECLFEQFDTLGVYSGAWTSGTIKKEEVIL